MFWVDAQSWLPLRVTNLDTPLFSIEFRATDWEEDTQGQLINVTGGADPSGCQPSGNGP